MLSYGYSTEYRFPLFHSKTYAFGLIALLLHCASFIPRFYVAFIYSKSDDRTCLLTFTGQWTRRFHRRISSAYDTFSEYLEFLRLWKTLYLSRLEMSKQGKRNCHVRVFRASIHRIAQESLEISCPLLCQSICPPRKSLQFMQTCTFCVFLFVV